MYIYIHIYIQTCMYVMMPCKYNNSANITTYIDKINSNNSIDNADNDNNKYVIYIYIYIYL